MQFEKDGFMFEIFLKNLILNITALKYVYHNVSFKFYMISYKVYLFLSGV